MTSPIYLALGSNLGDRAGNLQAARDALAPKVTVTQESPLYLTPPWGYLDQPEFLNQVIEVETLLHPIPLLHLLKDIEAYMGRQATFRNGPRLIDLDILFYRSEVIEGELLQIPHPRLHERAFVLIPLNDLSPDFIHPILNETVNEMLAKVDATGVRPL